MRCRPCENSFGPQCKYECNCRDDACDTDGTCPYQEHYYGNYLDRARKFSVNDFKCRAPIKDIGSTFVELNLLTNHEKYGRSHDMTFSYSKNIDVFNREIGKKVYTDIRVNSYSGFIRIDNLSPDSGYNIAYRCFLYVNYFNRTYTLDPYGDSIRTELDFPLVIGLTLGGIVLFYIILFVCLFICMTNNICCFKEKETAVMQAANF